MVFKNDAIKKAKELIQEIHEITDDGIPELAMQYVKAQKKEMIRTYLPDQEPGNDAVFMAGSPGAGKTEFVRSSFDQGVNVIEADRIRKNMPYYKGDNSHLFQRASSKAVNILLDHCFKHHLSYVLDGNFAVFKNQLENIHRCLERDYLCRILYVYRSPEHALAFTKLREEKEGRKISTEVFLGKSLGAIETTGRFINYNERVRVDLIDLEEDEIIEDVSTSVFTDRTMPLRRFCQQ